MVRKLIAVLLFLSVVPAILGGYIQAAKAEQTVFGPEKFLRTTGALNAYEETFQAEEGAGKLIIKNGEEDSKFRVTSAQIYLNEDPVIEPDDFKQDVYLLEFPLDLSRTNELKIEIGGKPDTFLLIEITQEKTASPPVFQPVEDQEVFEDHDLSFTVHAEDPNNDTLTYSASDLPSGAVFNPTTQAFSWTPGIGQAGVYYPEITVSDGDLTDTVTVKVTVMANSPTVSISADPEAIADGETSILSWTSTYADTASLEPGIGNVDVNGSLIVTPEETTIYTISVTGPGGTATDAAAVNVLHPPTVTFSAQPTDIYLGRSSLLSWESTNAESVVIEPGIGEVDLNGTMEVSPQETTTYTITAANGLGTTSESVTITVENPFTITVLSPQANAFITRPDVLVMGTIENAAGYETGIMVNNTVAVVHGNQFVANHVPLEDGINVIAITATDTEGSTYSVEHWVEADTSGDYIDITTTLESGLPPFESDLYINGTIPILSSTMAYTGPGTINLSQEEKDRYSAQITDQGIYVLTATVNYNGIAYQDRIAITGLNAIAVDDQIQAIWRKMKTCLINSNIEGALTYFHDISRDHQREVFTIIYDDLPGIAAGMRNIELIIVQNNIAKYRITREKIIQGQPYDITYYVIFSRSDDGWKIVRF
jgi:hypothetical protein